MNNGLTNDINLFFANEKWQNDLPKTDDSLGLWFFDIVIA